MASEKPRYAHPLPERSSRRERTGGPLGSVVGVLGAAAVFASAVVLAVIVQNIGHEMGNLRAKVERDQEEMAKLQERVATLAQGAGRAEKGHEEMAKLQERVATLTGKTDSLQARAERDQDEITKLQERVATLSARAERDHDDIAKLQAQAQKNHDDMAKLQFQAQNDQEEVLSLRERIVVLETQIQGGSVPPNYSEQQQQTSESPEGDSGPVGEIDVTAVQNNNVTEDGGLVRRRSKRDVPNFIPLPAGSGCCQAGRDGQNGRDGRDGVAGTPGLKGEPGQKGDIGPPGEPGAGAKGAKGETGIQGAKGQKGAQGMTGNSGLGAKGAKGETGIQGAKGQKGAQGTPGNNGLGGAVYTRWGRKTCPSGATTVYSGVAGGSYHNHPGGGTNYQCLPTNPQWGRYQDGTQVYSAYMYGAEYEIHTNVPFGSTSLLNHDVPCAVCYVPTRGSKLIIPARNTCPTAWTREYHGYLMAERHNHAGAKEFVCVDEQPEAAQGGQASQNQALFFPVEARCGSLPCPSYVEGRELTCAVCTK
ncbi:MARCO [Branchiostoma lanceolatum]|uniref:MARCO protein n=1 Tax=Branchiostoma lanceolatum TaxID=7740 RepID=A0A8J9V715_BRALA|nr:MARCO [Branchiostoma lanceolatum]